MNFEKAMAIVQGNGHGTSMAQLEALRFNACTVLHMNGPMRPNNEARPNRRAFCCLIGCQKPNLLIVSKLLFVVVVCVRLAVTALATQAAF
jgi:hypothetical protein